MSLIAWFNEIPDELLGQQAGGKGASLCRMSRQGYPVPEGFIVSSEMFGSFMEETGLRPQILGKIAAIDWEDDGTSLANVSRECRELISSAKMPVKLEELLRKYYSELGDNMPVAVRSSGTAEDLDDASFAGQQETFLFVIGADEVVKFVKEDWASLYNDRAIFYRRQKGFPEDQISIAVVVQRMINAVKAGVMFSANPITDDRNSVMIEAAWGLGEGIVQGIVTPDNLTIDKKTREVTVEYISEKEIMVVRLSERGGVKEIEVPEDIRNEPVLSEKERNALVDLAIKVENFYGKPQDLEWAYEGEKLYLLQSRPITTL